MDFRTPHPIGLHIDDADSQLVHAGGYDHNWVVDGKGLRPAAKAYAPQTGICLELLTTQPGVQFYTGNYLGDAPIGKAGAEYVRRSGFCLETQRYPDSPHHAAFPSAVLRKGTEYRETTVYRFSTDAE